MKSEMITIYTKEEDIKNIINKVGNYSFDELDKHYHFKFSIMEKLTEYNKLKEIFSKFNLIKSIELRENQKGQRYYSFNYELEDETFAVIVIVIDREKPLVINGFYAKTKYKNFEESLRKNYPHKFK